MSLRACGGVCPLVEVPTGSWALVEGVGYISLQSICSRQTSDHRSSRATVSSCFFLSPGQWRRADFL